MSKIIEWFKDTPFYNILIDENSKGESEELRELRKKVEKEEGRLIHELNISNKELDSKGAPNPKGGGQIQLSNMPQQKVTKPTVERIQDIREGR